MHQGLRQRDGLGRLEGGFRRPAAHVRHNQADRQSHCQQGEQGDQRKDDAGRFPPASNREEPRSQSQGRTQAEVVEPVVAVQAEHGEQLVPARERRDDDRQDVVFHQRDGHDQAYRWPQIPHRGGVRAATLVERAEGVHVQAAENQIGEGDDPGRDVPIVL